jgi:hypothetical protein
MSGGTGSSTGNTLASPGDLTANGNWTLAPGQTGSFTAAGFDQYASIWLKSLTFSFQDPPAVPEPGTVGLALIGGGLLGLRAWRRRRA